MAEGIAAQWREGTKFSFMDLLTRELEPLLAAKAEAEAARDSLWNVADALAKAGAQLVEAEMGGDQEDIGEGMGAVRAALSLHSEAKKR